MIRDRAALEALRALVAEAAPDASASLKWGMPFYTIGRNVVCALAGFKSHVNLILPGPPGTFTDPVPRGRGEEGTSPQLRGLEELPRVTVSGWLRTAAKLARQGGRAAANLTSRRR